MSCLNFDHSILESADCLVLTAYLNKKLKNIKAGLRSLSTEAKILKNKGIQTLSIYTKYQVTARE